MSAQRARSAIPLDHRSIHPRIAGVPWWAAVLIAVTATAVGFAFDAGSGTKELTGVFDVLYALGCVAAVLAVRQSALFTAVVQPPLILFAAVPGAYFVFQGAKFTGLKNLALGCGYPLIERFPLMVSTTAGVLLIGVVRWYLGLASRSAADRGEPVDSVHKAGPISALVSKLVAVGPRGSATKSKASQEPRARRHTVDRKKRPAVTRDGRRAERGAPSRARRGRPPLDTVADRATGRPRRTRTDGTGGHEFDPEAARPPRRRPRPPGERHDQPVRRVRRDPHRDETRNARLDRRAAAERREPPPRRRRPAPNGTNGTNGTNSNDTTHHPISRVRYRGSRTGDERPAEPPARSPRPRRPEADSWEYDI